MSVTMLSNVSSSFLNSSPRAGHDWGTEVELGDSGTLFAEILETASVDSSSSHTIMSDSDTDDDMLDFLTSKNFVKRSSTSGESDVLASKNFVKRHSTSGKSDVLPSKNFVKRRSPSGESDVLPSKNFVKRRSTSGESDVLPSKNFVKRRSTSGESECLVSKKFVKHSSTSGESDVLASKNFVKRHSTSGKSDVLPSKNFVKRRSPSGESDVLPSKNFVKRRSTSGESDVLPSKNFVKRRSTSGESECLVSKKFVKHSSTSGESDCLASNTFVKHGSTSGKSKLDMNFDSCSKNNTRTLDTEKHKQKIVKCHNRGSCMNSNAINARRNRMKKKRYICELEERIEHLESENKQLNSDTNEKSNAIDSLKNEVQYLRSVIANKTSLTTLLNHIPFSKGMQFGSSIMTSLIGKKNSEVSPLNAQFKSRKGAREEHSDSSNTDISISNEGDNVYIVKRVPKKQASERTVSSPCPGEYTASSPNEVNISSPREDSTNRHSSQTMPGVCLHVSSNKVSLEFCALCASNAASALEVAAVTDGTESDRENANVLNAG